MRWLCLMDVKGNLGRLTYTYRNVHVVFYEKSIKIKLSL
jgi:hypothetical protein